MIRGLSLVAALLLGMLVSGCSSLAGLRVNAAPAAPAQIEQIFVASSRDPATWTSVVADRSQMLSYARFDVAVPPDHVVGQIPQQSSVRAIPGHDFVLAGTTGFASASKFGAAVAANARAEQDGPAEVLVYVHGFNTSFVDAVYQLAQIGHDIELPAAKVLFQWPSNDRLLDYVHDLDSVAFARDGLERLLIDLSRSGVQRIVVAGYSMGAALVVETLRQMKLSGEQTFFAKLGGVVMLAPDIDVDVFRAAAERMGGLPQPFVVYGAPDDPALGVVERFLTAGKTRLGALTDPRVLADQRLTFVDLSNVPRQTREGHLPIATSPAMIAQVNAMARPDLVNFARDLAGGTIPGASVRKFGNLTYVTVSKPGN